MSLNASAGIYADLPNRALSASNGVSYTYRDTGDAPGAPLVTLQHFRGNLDSWDPALIDALACKRRVIAFDNRGVGRSSPRRAGAECTDGPQE
jgi:pimeloyl-ACP methyl ester carboxylesterase